VPIFTSYRFIFQEVSMIAEFKEPIVDLFMYQYNYKNI
jgi:hypothetical protein